MGTYTGINLDRERSFVTRPPVSMVADRAELAAIIINHDDSGYSMHLDLYAGPGEVGPIRNFERVIVSVQYAELSPAIRTKVQDVFAAFQVQAKNKLQAVGV